MSIPKVDKLEELQHYDDGAILYITGVMFTVYPWNDTTLRLYDGGKSTVNIVDVPSSMVPEYLGGNHKGIYTKKFWPSPDFYGMDVDPVYSFYKPKPGKCDCGAIYTTFPEGHFKWCDSHNLY